MTAPEVGRFFHHGWEVAADPNPVRARVASYHEFGHAALNSSTAWGGLLQQLAIAERIASGVVTPGVLGAAVAASRLVHEAYATQVSRSALVAQAEEVDRFLSGQAGYARFLSVACKIGPVGAAAEAWREGDGVGSARMAVLVACMQSPAVVRMLDAGTEHFQLADVPGDDWPDRRLRTFTRLAPDFWATLRPPSSEDDQFSYVLDAAADALTAVGHPTLSRAEYRALLPDFTADLNRLASATGREVELNLDGDTGIPGLFGSEVVRARAPLPTTVVSGLDPASADGLRTSRATASHLFVTVRRMRALRAQYDLRPDPGFPDDTPVTAVLTPDRVGDRVTGLRLTLLHSPGDIDVLARTAPAVTCLSLDCLREQAWSVYWLPTLRARTRVVGLLDLPPEAMIPAWLGTEEPLRAQLLATTAGDTAVVFRLADEEPVLLPVSAASMSALVILVDRVSAGSVRIEDDVLDDADETAARLVLDHIVAEDAVRPFIAATTPDRRAAR